MKFVKLFTLVIFTVFYSNSFSQIPHLSGDIAISIKRGTMTCDLMLSNTPAIKDYTIWLNTGLNVQFFKSDKSNHYSRRDYDPKTSYESFQYYMPGKSDTTKYLPRKFSLRYTGAFPVINDTSTMYNTGDWKGNIAFNGASVRAAESTAWYPILYNKAEDIVVDKYTYDVTVKCEDCQSIYINGDNPKKGRINNFSSSVPVALLIYAGNYDFIRDHNLTFINTTLKTNERLLLIKWTNNIIGFYEKHLKVPFGNNVTFLAGTPISKKNGWMFVTYPTIAVIGRDNSTIHHLFKYSTTPLTIDSTWFAYISHELGHYYFGTVLNPNSTLRWMFLEGVTEYLSWQYIRQEFGEEGYKKKLGDAVHQSDSFKNIIPISQIRNNSDINEEYRYFYVPLLLTALEKQIGMQKMWNWLTFILNDRTANTDYNYFKNSLLSVGVRETEFLDFEYKYINSNTAVNNVLQQ